MDQADFVHMVRMSEHADGEADDLPPATVTVRLDPSQQDRLIPHQDGLLVLINPQILWRSDEMKVVEEGCLSVPGLSWEIIRPNRVHVVGRDLDGNEVSIEASELEGRMFQHELDHLDGVLLIERLDEDQARSAKRQVRDLMLGFGAEPAPKRGLSLR